MVVISKAILKEFAEKNPDADIALNKWYSETKSADWRNFNELKRTVFLLFIGSHKEYDKVNASKIQYKK